VACSLCQSERSRVQRAAPITLYEHSPPTPSKIERATRGPFTLTLTRVAFPDPTQRNALIQQPLEDNSKDSDEDNLAPNYWGVYEPDTNKRDYIADRRFVFPPLNPTSCEQDVKRRKDWSIRLATSHEQRRMSLRCNQMSKRVAYDAAHSSLLAVLKREICSRRGV